MYDNYYTMANHNTIRLYTLLNSTQVTSDVNSECTMYMHVYIHIIHLSILCTSVYTCIYNLHVNEKDNKLYRTHRCNVHSVYLSKLKMKLNAIICYSDYSVYTQQMVSAGGGLY